MRWAAAIATDDHLDDAVGNAADEVLVGLGGAHADLVVAFVTDHHAARFARLAVELERSFPGALLVGCTAAGAIAGRTEVEHSPALSLTAAALPGVRLTPFHAGDHPRAWDDELDVGDDADAFLILPCALSSPTEDLLGWMDDRWPDAVKVGGLASGGMTTAGPRGNTLFLGERRYGGGAVGVALAGDVHVETVVAQGSRPIGEPMFVTRVAGGAALQLDGAPALTALERLVAGLAPEERELARHSLVLGVAMSSAGPFDPGDFLVRPLAIEPETGAVAASTPLELGQVVQFHLRDGRAATAELTELLARREGPPPEGALLFSCVGRGRLLFGRGNHDSRAFARAVGDVPLGGFFGNGEIGPVHGRTFLHGYTASFALFRRKLALA